ncbi:MAG: sugar ABC transporter ATP-binding protein [Candidatus Accumulibacter sp.]|jgi:ribose transport system ATP-binding protein|nr:sugar ABC transporter ATP-binding protein [Accumulibacter sp.]
MDTVLRLERISKRFPGVNALTDIDLTVEKGEIHALLGENGAGKSTLMKILSGIHQPDEGRILLDGEERNFASYNQAVAAGVSIIFQEFSLIPDLDAVENIYLGREYTHAFGFLARGAMRREAHALFEKLGIAIDLDAPVRQLSVAQQQFVEIAKALSLNARILILDEPTATLTPSEAGHLFSIMRELKAHGVTMIFISHHLEEIFEICDRITVLRDGGYVGTTRVEDTDVDQLVEWMVGRRLEQAFPPKPALDRNAPEILAARNVQLSEGAPVNSFALRAGEILGFAGLVGSGRSELARAVIGADPAFKKEIYFHGQRVALKDTAETLACGIGLLPENRKTEGLIVDFAIRDNISINNLGKYLGVGPFIDHKAEYEGTHEAMRHIGVKAPDPMSVVGQLSGGNQQKVVIARWLNHRCKVLIFDEPTRGIDVGAKAEIYLLMRRLTGEGYSILFISSELPEIVGLCDRVAIFRQGAIVATLEGDEINSSEVMRHATTGN